MSTVLRAHDNEVLFIYINQIVEIQHDQTEVLF